MSLITHLPFPHDDGHYLRWQNYLVSPSYAMHWTPGDIAWRRVPHTERRLCYVQYEDAPITLDGQYLERVPIYFEVQGQISRHNRHLAVEQGRARSSTRLNLRIEPRPNSDAQNQWVHMQVCLQRIANVAAGGVDLSSLFPDITDINFAEEPLQLAVEGVKHSIEPEQPGFPIEDGQGNVVLFRTASRLPTDAPVRVAFTLEHPAMQSLYGAVRPLAKIHKIALA